MCSICSVCVACVTHTINFINYSQQNCQNVYDQMYVICAAWTNDVQESMLTKLQVISHSALVALKTSKHVNNPLFHYTQHCPFANTAHHSAIHIQT